ncbi:thylakoid membrane photosystem I accumulation factor [Gloeocapsa sp. PCC 73106]|uniref:thylakoid membrane photosystem I accumulation factor n=1 Tax=Gloeocapsa sp. PCC 73106 TaxID=102232 RepID=UPI0002AC9A02|nr:thylakoid membrane photosystem I accumulation factor [Gloeocapsa sp. PCC 73106]ELR99274.1 hypothetical protein GLO73106DRAFT_00031240 [Gloeocapsa sp. PCC 73106]
MSFLAVWQRYYQLLVILLLVFCLSSLGNFPVLAGINDDTYEGNIYILYAGNGSLVPSRLTLAQTLARETPGVLVFCVDDSSDCKQYSIVVSRLQEYYGKAASIIPVAVDSLGMNSNYTTAEPGYYYQGVVPQTVVIDQKGQVVLNAQGQIPYEQVDDVLRKVFDLLPRSESVKLKRRSFNEYNTELTN